MSKYKVGDVVKLRDDLEVEEEYGDVAFLSAMKTLQHKALRIDNIDVDRDGRKAYCIKGWYISDEMIEGLWEECKEKQDKLKLIDVFNMVAKGELKEGTKVKYEDIELNFKNGDLEDEDGYSIACIMNNLKDLLSEVELIEPPCEHEWSKYSVGRLGRTENYRRCKKCGIHEEDIEPIDNTKIEELDKEEMLCLTLQCAIAVLTDKLNEVIRMVNAITNLLN